MTGYCHPRYGESLREWGTLRRLPGAGASIIERKIPGTGYRDAMGCYPLFACDRWDRLAEDLDDLGGSLVTLTVVTDPFGSYDADLLHRAFSDHVSAFKLHYVTELGVAPAEVVSKHHRSCALRSLRKVVVEELEEPRAFLAEWIRLYQTLARRHNLRGMHAFSPTAFARQLDVPGLIVLRARIGDETLGAQLWYVQGEVAYSHLLALSDHGYQVMASYALHWAAIEQLAGRVRWLDLGGGAGALAASRGLEWFKRGWSTGQRMAYLCGRIFDAKAYSLLVDVEPKSDYFPAYRVGEFG